MLGNEQKQNSGQKIFFKKYGIWIAVIVICILVLTDIAVNLSRRTAKEDTEPQETVETIQPEAVEEEEESLVEKSEEEDFEEKEELEEQKDSIEELEDTEENIEGGSNVNGNTNMNIKNGGWVAEQGDWNYYLFWNSVLKENVETGEKIYLYEFEDPNEVNLGSLYAMGEWIYFSSEGEENRIFRLKTDWSEFQSLESEWQKDVLAWGMWKDKVYVILKEYASAQSYTVCAAAVDWENGTYEIVCDLLDSDGKFFVGFEEQLVDLENPIYHYVGIYGRNLYIYRDKNKRAVLAYDLETGELTEYPCNWSFHVADIYADNDFLYGVGYSVKDESILIQRSLGFIDLNTYQEYEYNEIGLSENDKINEINRTDDGYVVVGSSHDGISILDSSDGTVSNVVPDIAGDICVAHNKIYYQCEGRYCEMNADGLDWKEVDEREFLSAGLLEKNGRDEQALAEYKDAYYEFLAENESMFLAEMGEFEKVNEESYQKANAFLLVDMDQDGLPELVVKHPDAYKSDRLYVYTYKSGSVVQVKNVDGTEGKDAFINISSQANGLYSVFGCGQNHLHVVWNAEGFGRSDRVYRVQNEMLELYAESEEVDELGVYTYKIEGEEVESMDYNVFLEACGGNLKDLESNVESNREKYLK